MNKGLDIQRYKLCYATLEDARAPSPSLRTGPETVRCTHKCQTGTAVGPQLTVLRRIQAARSGLQQEPDRDVLDLSLIHI